MLMIKSNKAKSHYVCYLAKELERKNEEDDDEEVVVMMMLPA